MAKPSEELKEKMAAFKESVYGLECAGCEELRWASWYPRAHHVVYRQHLPVEHEWDPRNALPVCDRCHERHHNASKRLPRAVLTGENLEFAREVLGEGWEYYIDRYYGGSDV